MKKVFIGLLTFSLGAYIALSFVNVFAFTNPSANPPDGNVTPNFSGLILDGDANAANGRFTTTFNPATATATLGGSSSLTVDSIVTTFTKNAAFNSGVATNTITPYAGINTAPIRIRGATSVENTLDVWGNISNSSLNGDVTVNDNLTMSPATKFTIGDNGIYSTDPVNKGIRLRGNTSLEGIASVTGDLDVRGQLKNNGGDVIINDKTVMKGNVDIEGTLRDPDLILDVTGGVWATGVINSDSGLVAPTLNVTNPIENTSDNKLTLQDNSGIDINPLGGNQLTINGTGDAIGSLPSGILNIRNGARGVVFDQNEIMSVGGALYINDEGGQNVYVGNAVAPSNLTVYGALNSSTSIGRFYSTEVFTAIAANVTDIASAVCDAGDFRIACSGSTSNMDNLVFHGAWTTGDRTCTARLKNKNNAVANIYARAYCFSPNG